jgi:Flp pilus assembly secretin CpaC
MKTILIAFLLCGICSANENPKHVRVSIQFIEVPHPVLTNLLAGDQTGGPAIHAKAMALSKTGAAKILETCMLVCRSGQKATVESIREEIYPTEYSPPELPGTFSGVRGARTPSTTPLHPMLRAPTAFETRNTGVTLEVEPTVGENDQIIDLRLNPEVVTRLRLDTWMEHKDPWGNAPIRMPVFETWRANTSLTLLSGKFGLVSVITPKPDAPAPAVTQRILLFVRADVLPDPGSP